MRLDDEDETWTTCDACEKWAFCDMARFALEKMDLGQALEALDRVYGNDDETRGILERHLRTIAAASAASPASAGR